MLNPELMIKVTYYLQQQDLFQLIQVNKYLNLILKPILYSNLAPTTIAGLKTLSLLHLNSKSLTLSQMRGRWDIQFRQQITKYLETIISKTKLESLNVSYFEYIPDSLCRFIAREIGQNLLTLDLEKCKIESKTLNYMLKLCPNLKDLNLNDSEAVCDDNMLQVSLNCIKLEYLSIENCFNVTNFGVNLISKLKNIKKIYCVGLDIQSNEVVCLNDSDQDWSSYSST